MMILRSAAFLAGLVYLSYRLVFTWSGANPVLYFLLLTAEAFGVLRLAMETSVVGKPRPANRTPDTVSSPDAELIVVVTDEPSSEVRAAVLSARLVNGCSRIVVVDRDKRVDVSDLCKRLSLDRIVGGHDADLGELLDEALDGCESELALIIPADLVVMPDALEVSVAAFEDSEVAVVVSRVEHTNALNTIDYGGYGEDRTRDELMVDVLEPEGALPWWSGMALVRRSAIADAGGMARGSHGVMLSTGIRLQAGGWRITDVAVVVARRLAPWTDDRQLHRWSRDLYERLSVLVDSDAPRRNDYATRLSRRVYRLADVQVGRSIQRLVLIGVLFAVMFTSSIPMVADPIVLVPLWAAWQLSSYALRRVLYRRVGFVAWMSNDLRLLTTNLMVALRALPGRELHSDLTEPGPGRRGRSLFLSALMISIGAAVAVFATGVLRPPHGDFVTLATLALATWVWVAALQARTGLKFIQARKTYRTFEELEVYAASGRMGVIGVSPFGLDVISAEPLDDGAKVRLGFGLPRPDGTSRRMDVSTTVKRVSRHGIHHLAFLRFGHLDDYQMDVITEYCAAIAGQRALRDASSAPLRAGATSRAESAESGVAEGT